MLTFVPTPIGNISDITLRAMQCLQDADVILCEDTRVTGRLLDLLAKRHDCRSDARLLSFHEHNQHARVQSFDRKFFAQNIVYVSDAGMPAVSDPGSLLVRFCRQEEIPYDVLPGPSAAVTAYAASGFEGGFWFYGFLPRKKRQNQLQKLLWADANVIIYEAPHRIEKLLAQIDALKPEAKLFAAKEISKRHQSFFYGHASQIKPGSSRGEWVVIIQAAPKSTVELSQEAILDLDLGPRQKSKLLAQTGEKSAKQWYNELQKRD